MAMPRNSLQKSLRNKLHGSMTILAPQLCVLPANTAKDFQLGDVKGQAHILSEAVRYVSLFEKGARLFLTGGFTGRTGDNVGVMEMLLAGKAHGYLYAVAGYKEDRVLRILRQLEGSAAYIDKLEFIPTKDSNHPFRLHLNTSQMTEKEIEKIKPVYDYLKEKALQSGTWMMQLFQLEMRSQRIIINPDKSIAYTATSRVKAFSDYLRSLPRLIHVKGNKYQIPFYVVPWKIPVSDAELQVMIDKVRENNMPFSLEQLKYLTGEIANDQTKAETISKETLPDTKKHWGNIFCFHGYVNVGAKEKRSLDELTKAFEPNTNTINLYALPEKTNFSFLFCSTKGTVQWLGSGLAISKATKEWKDREERYKLAGAKINAFNRVASFFPQHESTEAYRGTLEWIFDLIKQRLFDAPHITYVCAIMEYAVHCGLITAKDRFAFYYSLVCNVRLSNKEVTVEEAQSILDALNQRGAHIEKHLSKQVLMRLYTGFNKPFAPHTVITWNKPVQSLQASTLQVVRPSPSRGI